MRVAFVIQPSASAATAAEALRAAVGMLAAGLAPRVLVRADPAVALGSREAARALGTLRGLGHEVRVDAAPGALAGWLEGAEAVEVWA